MLAYDLIICIFVSEINDLHNWKLKLCLEKISKFSESEFRQKCPYICRL